MSVNFENSLFEFKLTVLKYGFSSSYVTGPNP